jgi:hypothetical protein
VRRLQVADLSDEARLARVGLAPPVPGRRTWPAYQEVGETLWEEGWPGLLAPSAARSRGLILCLFVERMAKLPAEPIPPPAELSVPPAPPTGLRT